MAIAAGPLIPEGPETKNLSPSEFAAIPLVKVTKEGAKKGSYQLICSGTLIGTRTLLTAAHCFYTRNGEKLVRINQDASAWAYSGDDEKKKENLVKIDCDIHPGYIPGVNEPPDFAMCLLSKALPSVRPEWITLNANVLRMPEKQRLHLLGFGCTEQMGPSKPLNDDDIRLRTAPADVEASRLPYQGGGEFIVVDNNRYKRVLCAGDSGGGAVASLSSGGEPLNVEKWEPGGRVVLVGVNSALVRENESLSLLASTVSANFRFFLERWQQEHPLETICDFDRRDAKAVEICRRLSIR